MDKKLIQEFYDSHKKTQMHMIKTGQSPSPCVMFMLKEKDVGVAPMLMENPLPVCNQLIQRTQPDAYMVVVEGWAKMMKGKSKEDIKKYQKNYEYGSIQNEPDKKEVLNIIGKSKDGLTNIEEIYFIQRDKDDKITDFEPMNYDKAECVKLP